MILENVENIKNKTELKEYCLRRLGYPLITIEVTEEQINDCINEAILLFIERYYDGLQRGLIKKELNIEDFKNLKKSKIVDNDFQIQSNEIKLPNNVWGVNYVFPLLNFNQFNFMNPFWSIIYELAFNVGSGDIISYKITKEYISLINFITSGNYVNFKYDRLNNKIKIYFNQNIESISYNKKIFLILDVFYIEDYDTPRFWSDYFLRTYTFLLIKRQWGQNLIKFSNFQLPGGGTLNGEKIYNEAKEEIEKLHEEMKDKYQLPALDRVL